MWFLISGASTVAISIAGMIIHNLSLIHIFSHCPMGLDIPGLLALYNEHAFTEGGFIAPMALSAIPEDQQPSACIGCGSCEEVCPQQIHIPDVMEDFVERLNG